MLRIEEKEKTAPLYLQLYRQIKEEIRGRVRPAGSRLPSKRKLAAELGISINTVEGAYGQLISEGFIEAHPQRGYYVCQMDELMGVELKRPVKHSQPPRPQKLRVDFSTAHIDRAHFPYNGWRRMLKNCFDEYNETLLDSPPPQGLLSLRQSVAEYLYQARDVHCTAEQVVIGAGTDHLLQTISALLPPEFTFAVENPFYLHAADHFSRTGHPVRFVELDRRGMPVQPLETLKRAAVYVSPSHQFPLGITMPVGRRIQLLNWAGQQEQRYIIEDDYDSEFRYDARPIASMQGLDQNGRVIYLGTFSKAIAPSLRISYMVLPESLLTVYHEKFGAYSPAASGFEQLVLQEFLQSGAFETHLNKMRKLYREKRETMTEALKAWGGQAEILGANAGHHVLLRLHGDLSEEKMCRMAKYDGVQVYPVSRYFHGRVPKEYHSTVLLGYAGLSKDDIKLGVELLHRAWTEGEQA